MPRRDSGVKHRFVFVTNYGMHSLDNRQQHGRSGNQCINSTSRLAAARSKHMNLGFRETAGSDISSFRQYVEMMVAVTDGWR